MFQLNFSNKIKYQSIFLYFSLYFFFILGNNFYHKPNHFIKD